MTQLSREILEKYQIRKTKRQKDAFIALLKEHYPSLYIEESRFPKSRNLIIGDPDKANILLTAHYDTCSQLPIPNFIAPKNPLLSIAYSLLLVVPFIGILFLFNFLLNLLSTDFWIHYILTLVLYFSFFGLLLAGPANKHNANDNTSGVIALCELLESLSSADREKVAFVFFDNEESGLLGSSSFRSKHKTIAENTLVINFDCVSDGDYLLLAVTKNARTQFSRALADAFESTAQMHIMLEKAEQVYYPSDQMGFKHSVAVAALKHSKLLGYYMDKIHTKNDTVFQKDNIDYIKDSLCKFIAKL